MSDRGHILIIEDEEAIRTGLTDTFIYHGFTVDAAADGSAGLKLALQQAYDLIILDIMLPEIDGFQICEEIRAKDRDQPIIMLTAKDSEADIIEGLRLGADDYVTKPFSVQELVLRAQAVLRRSGTAGVEDQLLIGKDLEIDCRNLCGHSNSTGASLEFTRRELDILTYLLKNRERPVSRDELLVKVWGYGRASRIETRTVDIHIAKLRKKIEPDPKHPSILVTVRGEGYRLLGGGSRD